MANSVHFSLSSWSKNLPLWAFGSILWLVTLCYLSHGNRFPDVPGPPIPHFDKILHFGYFLGGGGLFSGYLYLRKPTLPLRKLLFVVAPILSMIGAADEFHQSFFENRSGNDPGDWLADTLGGAAGVLFFWKLRHLFSTPDK